MLIVYAITYFPESTRSPLRDAGPPKGYPSPLNSKKLSPWKRYHFKILQPPNFRGGSYPANLVNVRSEIQR